MTRHRPALIASLASVAVLASVWPEPAHAEDWPQWRGPHRDNISRESGWLNGTPAEAWRAPVGLGHSTVSVVGDRVYTQGWVEGGEDGLDKVSCLSAATGAEIWSHTFPAERWQKFHHGGTNCTPSVHDGKVYVANREGKLMCLSAADGSVAWQKDLAREYGVQTPEWGFAASPLVVDGKIIVCMNYVFAFDDTGKELWASPASYGTSYGTPVDYTQDGERRLACFAGEGLVLLRLEDGTHIGTYPWKTNYNINASTPIVLDGDRAFISSGYNHGCAMVDISESELKPIWESKVMRTKMSGAILHGEHLYGFDESELKCIDLDGNEVWAQRGLGMGALTLSDGKLIIVSSRGELVIADASPEGYHEVAKVKALDGKEFWASPVLANGRIYLRSVEGELAAWKCE